MAHIISLLTKEDIQAVCGKQTIVIEKDLNANICHVNFQVEPGVIMQLVYNAYNPEAKDAQLEQCLNGLTGTSLADYACWSDMGSGTAYIYGKEYQIQLTNPMPAEHVCTPEQTKELAVLIHDRIY